MSKRKSHWLDENVDALSAVAIILLISAGMTLWAYILDMSDIINKFTSTAIRQEFINLVTQVADINSCTTTNFPGIKQTANFFAEKFEGLGFKSKWHELPKEVERAGHLVLAKKNNNKKNKKILFIGHLDTVYPMDTNFNQAYLDPNNSNYLIGPGVLDMKGGIVMLLLALKYIFQGSEYSKSELLPDITIILTGDEENTGAPVEISRKLLVDLAKNHDYAYGLEFNHDINKVVTQRRGIRRWQLDVKTQAGHSSHMQTNLRQCPGAIFLTMEILHTVLKNLKNIQDLSFNPGIINGGMVADLDLVSLEGYARGKSNVIANHCLVYGDMRYAEHDDLDKVQDIFNTLKNDLKHKSKNQELEFKLLGAYHPPLSLHKNTQILLDKINNIQAQIGLEKISTFAATERGAADSNYVSEYLPVVDGLGAIGEYAHISNKEYINLDLTLLATQRLAKLILT